MVDSWNPLILMSELRNQCQSTVNQNIIYSFDTISSTLTHLQSLNPSPVIFSLLSRFLLATDITDHQQVSISFSPSIDFPFNSTEYTYNHFYRQLPNYFTLTLNLLLDFLFITNETPINKGENKSSPYEFNDLMRDIFSEMESDQTLPFYKWLIIWMNSHTEEDKRNVDENVDDCLLLLNPVFIAKRWKLKISDNLKGYSDCDVKLIELNSIDFNDVSSLKEGVYKINDLEKCHNFLVGNPRNSNAWVYCNFITEELGYETLSEGQKRFIIEYTNQIKLNGNVEPWSTIVEDIEELGNTKQILKFSNPGNPGDENNNDEDYQIDDGIIVDDINSNGYEPTPSVATVITEEKVIRDCNDNEQYSNIKESPLIKTPPTLEELQAKISELENNQESHCRWIENWTSIIHRQENCIKHLWNYSLNDCITNRIGEPLTDGESQVDILNQRWQSYMEMIKNIKIVNIINKIWAQFTRYYNETLKWREESLEISEGNITNFSGEIIYEALPNTFKLYCEAEKLEWADIINILIWEKNNEVLWRDVWSERVLSNNWELKEVLEPLFGKYNKGDQMVKFVILLENMEKEEQRE